MMVIKTFIISILIFLSLFSGTFAAQSEQPADFNAENCEIQPRVEETTWYYREVNGVKQMRLWSVTYGKWLTDWINV